MKNGLEITILWFDIDAIKLQINASNGRFAGTVVIYESKDVFEELTREIHGYPKSISDVRKVQLGTFDNYFVGGGVGLRFFCDDGQGHSMIELDMKTDPQYYGGNLEMTKMVMAVEAAAIDDFVLQLKSVQIEIGSTVFLPQST